MVDRCVSTVECVRIVHRSRLLDWIKSCCYIKRYIPLDLCEPASGVIRIRQCLSENLKCLLFAASYDSTIVTLKQCILFAMSMSMSYEWKYIKNVR